MAKQTTRGIILDAIEYLGFLAQGDRKRNPADLMAAADYASRLADQLRQQAAEAQRRREAKSTVKQYIDEEGVQVTIYGSPG
jgi:hypothetical protein